MDPAPASTSENAIAVVGMACVYPDATTPAELWENVLAQRRSFRRLPPERLRLENFLSEDRDAEDSTYATQAAVIADYHFDRDRFRIGESTYRSTDLTHWLALDVATRALADAGFADGDGLPRGTTGVILGNTLTGEFSRANVLRLRWHYVRAAAEQAWVEAGLPMKMRDEFFRCYEARFKAPFPPIDSDSLAGGLANTIAGRICNYHDLQGGGYTVDGACASSLLAVAHACSALAGGDLDVALAGGVDLSLDPFELIGFAKVGALAPDEMRVFDVRSQGFWPGEGCGFLVLMPHHRAVEQGRRIYATIRGWGISSDGHGGLTRPELDGQVLAMQRAYRRAGFGAESVGYFEGHGTGTTVGDATELRAISTMRRHAESPAAIGSIKANIGHTKAAAGVAGLLKAILTVHHGIVPPTSGCDEPQEALCGPDAPLRVVREAQPWPDAGPRRAAASAMGFGGINSHIVIESAGPAKGCPRAPRLAASAQDAEIFLFEAESKEALLAQVTQLAGIAAQLSFADLADLAAELESQLDGGKHRAALIVSTPADLASRLDTLAAWLRAGGAPRLDADAGIFLGEPRRDARIGFLFPGQAAPVYRDGGIFARRFGTVRELYGKVHLPVADHAHCTAVAQPAVVAASAAGMRVLAELGIEARVAVGHSLGEISGLHWAGAMDEDALLAIATARGRAMAESDGPAGTMAAIEEDAEVVGKLLLAGEIHVVGLNSPRQTVVSGATAGVRAFVELARSRGLRAAELPVAHAFHTPLVASAATALAAMLRQQQWCAPRRRLISTVTGAALEADEDLREILCRQITAPVRFIEALRLAAKEVDLFIEVGPGHLLTGLAGETVPTPCLALDAGGASLRGLLAAAGAAFVLGTAVQTRALFEGRCSRAFDPARRPTFFANPCESITPGGEPAIRRAPAAKIEQASPAAVPSSDTRGVVREVVARQMKLPAAAIKDDSRMLSDLHLNSITVGQLVADAARRLGTPKLVDLTRFANATVGQIAEALEEIKHAGPGPATTGGAPAGLAPWIESFHVALVEKARAATTPELPAGSWTILAPEGHPLKSSLAQGLPDRGGGVVVCLPEKNRAACIPLLLHGAQLAMQHRGATRFVLVQHDDDGAAFARTLHRETPGLTTCVVTVPSGHPRAAEWVVAETLTAVGYTEAHYDAAGTRREPVLQWLPLAPGGAEIPLGPADVVLVSGGGKGITAECALELARRTGAALAILGRSPLAGTPELRRNLERIAAAGVRVQYLAVDVADAAAVRDAVAEIERTLGPVTSLLHGAGRNDPHSIAVLDETMVARTLAPKVHGAENLLAAINPEKLRLLVTFGSIIARIGLAGEADYALANSWLASLTAEFQAAHPHCQCLCLEWSVWSSLGMGQKLGRVEALLQHGVTAIPPEEGVRLFCAAIAARPSVVSLVITGRFGQPPTLHLDLAPLPPGRFLKSPRAQYPVELVCDTDLSAENDPYVNEHQLQGQRLFPAVVALEAMAQTAMALARSSTPPVIEDAQFHRPVVVPDAGKTTIRIQALQRRPGEVELALLCEDTGFAVNHFTATCRFDPLATPRDVVPEVGTHEAEHVALEPATDLYDDLLFHTGRFRRVAGYRRLTATECVAELSGDPRDTWFGNGLPQTLVLGDPAARDAALHAIQACIPHRRILPLRVQRMVINAQRTTTGRVVIAKERSRTADEFVYDVTVREPDGSVIESWEGLCLRAVAPIARQKPWADALLAPYMERRLAELLPNSAVAVSLSARVNGTRTAHLAEIHRRPDGKPDLAGANQRHISTAHAGRLTLAVSSAAGVSCDLESVRVRRQEPGAWADLLTHDQQRLVEIVGRETSEDSAVAAARVWAAAECLKKAGIPGGPSGPLTLGAHEEDRWLLLGSPLAKVATWTAQTHAEPGLCVFAFLVETPRPAPPAKHGQPNGSTPQRTFEYRHVVTFEETNVVGNVYFVNHLSWQGRCREMFLREKAPQAIKELDEQGLSLATSSVAVEYFEELFPFDEVVVRMTLRELTPGAASLVFDYLRRSETSLTLIARGQHTVAVKAKAGASSSGPAIFPPALARALAEYLPG